MVEHVASKQAACIPVSNSAVSYIVSVAGQNAELWRQIVKIYDKRIRCTVCHADENNWNSDAVESVLEWGKKDKVVRVRKTCKLSSNPLYQVIANSKQTGESLEHIPPTNSTEKNNQSKDWLLTDALDAEC